MKVIKADPERLIEIPGVPGPVQRPVDIDRSRTNFASLRSLRIYRFHAGAIIDGHAEEDEVFVVALAGSIEFAASGTPPGTEERSHHLSSPNNSHLSFCAAYLPPHAAYRLAAKSDSVIAYARATPTSGNPAAFFQATGLVDDTALGDLLEESTYAQRLRLRLFHINASVAAVDFKPVNESEAEYEALVHVQFTSGGNASATTSDAQAGSLSTQSWDTVAISPGEHPAFHFLQGSKALVLVVLAV